MLDLVRSLVAIVHIEIGHLEVWPLIFEGFQDEARVDTFAFFALDVSVLLATLSLRRHEY